MAPYFSQKGSVSVFPTRGTSSTKQGLTRGLAKVCFYPRYVWQRLNFSRSSRASVFTAGVSSKEFLLSRWSSCSGKKFLAFG